MDDRAQLEHELSWVEPTRLFNRRKVGWYQRPMGYNAVLALTGVVWLLLIGVTAAIMPRGDDLYAIAALVLMGIEAFVASSIAWRVWRVLGPWPRYILRKVALLHMPGLLLFFLMMYVVVSTPFRVMTAVRKGVDPRLALKGILEPVEGNNWQILVDREGYARLSLSAAELECAQRGARLPLPGELDSLSPLPVVPERMQFWLPGPHSDQVPSVFSIDDRTGRLKPVPTIMVQPPTRANVLCLKEK